MRPGIREGLLARHRVLEATCAELQEAVDAGADRRSVVLLWSRFAVALREHMRDEEEHLVPLVRDRHREEIAALLVQHEQFRGRLDAMGTEAELHLLRAPRVDEFLRELRAHAQLEDRGFYRWVEEATDQRLRARLRRLLWPDAEASGAAPE